jgi:hypothetical protein
MSMNRLIALVSGSLMAAGLLSACNHAKDSAQVARDVSNAEQGAAEGTAKAERSAEAKVGAQLDDAAHTAAVQEQKVEVADAEGTRKVALAQCEALSGANQKACRDQADAAYQETKAQAKQERLASDPKQ